ncbi:MAG: glycosyltransferase family 4 protein [Bryobacteraceae bacterium]
MNILQVISSGGYYGAESMLLALARALPGVGCGSTIAVFSDSRTEPGGLETHAARRGLRVEVVPCNGRWDWKAVRRIRELAKEHRVDVLHTHGYKADIYGGAAAWRGRVSLVATCHNWPSRLASMRAYAAIDRQVLRHFDRVATASDPVAEILTRAGIPAHKLRTIPNGVDTEAFREAPASLRAEMGGGAERLIGFVGRLVPDKGGAVLLAAAQTVLTTYPDAKFVFVGEGPARQEWETRACELGIASKVVFTGGRDDMPSVYASLDLVVLPSFQEAMPMCLLEALAAARPVVATAVGAVPKVVIPGVTGLLCDPGDVSGLSAAILRVIREPDLARMFGNNGRAHVARHYAAKVVARRYVDLYREVLGERACRANVPALWQRSRS